jgi:hypothetical protein
VVRTVERVPFTADGDERLAAELERAHDVVDPPALVWLFRTDTFDEQRGTLYAWRDGAPRRGLVVWREPERRGYDCVEWLCEPYLRPRRE